MTHQDLQLKKSVKKPIEILGLQNLTLSFSKKHFLTNEKLLLTAFGALEKLAGFRSKGTTAIRSISDFKLRSGQLIGCKINVCGYQAHTFIDKLITQVLPANSDQHLKNDKKLVTFSNAGSSLISQSRYSNRDVFEIRPSFANSNWTYSTQGSFNTQCASPLTMKAVCFSAKKSLFSSKRRRALNERTMKLEGCNKKTAVIALNLSDPLQSCELEDNFEIFENVNCIELRLTISLEKPSHYFNYSSFFY